MGSYKRNSKNQQSNWETIGKEFFGRIFPPIDKKENQQPDFTERCATAGSKCKNKDSEHDLFLFFLQALMYCLL